MKLHRPISIALLCILVITSLLSCSQKASIGTESILLCMLESEHDLPSGRIYTSGAAEGEDGFTPASLLSALYGDGEIPPESEEWIEYAIFLSSTACPCEFAVFLCESPQACSDTSKMLCRRLDTLSSGHKNGDYSRYIDNAAVTVSKNYCILSVSSDTQNAKERALSLIG